MDCQEIKIEKYLLWGKQGLWHNPCTQGSFR